MKPFNLEEVRANKPFEVFFHHVGWIEGKLKHVSKHDCGAYEIKVSFDDLRVVDTEWFLLPSDRLSVKEC
jgi:hypothetical protein